MTQEAAIEQMKRGEKITHRYFSNNEWMTMENGMILLEDGYKIHPDEFWGLRHQDGWKDGYEYYG